MLKKKSASAALITWLLKSYIRGNSPIESPKALLNTDQILVFSERQMYSICHPFRPVKYGLQIRTWCLESGSRSARVCWKPACSPTLLTPPFLDGAQCTVCKRTQGNTVDLFSATQH